MNLGELDTMQTITLMEATIYRYGILKLIYLLKKRVIIIYLLPVLSQANQLMAQQKTLFCTYQLWCIVFKRSLALPSLTKPHSIHPQRCPIQKLFLQKHDHPLFPLVLAPSESSLHHTSPAKLFCYLSCPLYLPWMDRHRRSPKWHSIPFIVHYFWPGPIVDHYSI